MPSTPVIQQRRRLVVHGLVAVYLLIERSTSANVVVGARCDDDPDGAGSISEVIDAGTVFVFDMQAGDHSHGAPEEGS